MDKQTILNLQFNFSSEFLKIRKMGSKYPLANHLLDDEVDYELRLRNYVEELGTDMEVKQRLLRRVFYKDAKENREYRSPYTIEQEFDVVFARVSSIRTGLAKGYDDKLISRLKHYFLRVERSIASDEAAEKMKSSLLGNIRDLLEVNNALGPMVRELDPLEVTDSGETSQEDTDESDHGAGLPKPKVKGKKKSLKTKGSKKQKRNLGPMKKGSKEKTKVSAQDAKTKQSEDLKTKAKIADLEAQIETLTSLLRAKMQTPPNNQGQGNRLDGNNQQRGGSGAPYPWRPQNQQQWPGQRGQNNYGQDGGNGYSSSEATIPEGEVPNLNGFGRPHREDRVQYDRKMEKWNLVFAGDARSISLEDFIFKVKVLASMNGIPNNHLLSNIHLLLRGEASNWFFTYYHPGWNWEMFEASIRFRFGNPNQDQGNRQRIYDRKQQKGETFIAFVTEIERLNKLLTNPLSSRRKFEIVWENMRQHYRSKLACFTIDSLEELIQVNYRIDANDPSLHPVGPKFSVHNLEEEKEDESTDEEVNAIGGRPVRNQNQGSTPGRTAQMTRRQDRQETRVPLCWNCRQNGHFWRDCGEAKTTFCYVCGNPGKISSTCDKHPRRTPQNQTAETGQSSGN